MSSRPHRLCSGGAIASCLALMAFAQPAAAQDQASPPKPPASNTSLDTKIFKPQKPTLSSPAPIATRLDTSNPNDDASWRRDIEARREEQFLNGASEAAPGEAPGAGYRQQSYTRPALDTVIERARPELNPIGIPAGAFTLFPTLTVGGIADSNVLRQANGEGDAGISGAIEAALRSNWTRNSLALYGRVLGRAYAGHATEDGVDFRVGSDGELQVGDRSAIDFSLSHASALVQRGATAETLNTLSPVRHHLTRGQLGTRLSGNHLIFELDGAASYDDYSNSESITHQPIDQNYRDVVRYIPSATVTYLINPDFGVFVQGQAEFRRYPHPRPGVNRDADAPEVLIGFNYTPSPVLRTSLATGWHHENFISRNFQDISLFVAQGSITWLATELTTVHFDAERRIGNPAVVTSSLYTVNRFALRLDHELKRNFILSGTGRFEQANYRNLDREDRTYGAGLIGEWLASRRYAVDIAANYTRRDSGGPDAGVSFDDFRFTIGLTFRR